jgi:hypothetical protein
MFGLGAAAVVWTLDRGDALPLRGVKENLPRAALPHLEFVAAATQDPIPTASLTFVAAAGDSLRLEEGGLPSQPPPPLVDESPSPPVSNIQPVGYESDVPTGLSAPRPGPVILTGRIEPLPPSR